MKGAILGDYHHTRERTETICHKAACVTAHFLRQQIRAALELLRSRLYSMERARRVGPTFAHAGFGAIHAAKR